MPKGVPGSKAPHGTTARYKTHGCRCDECRGAWREFSRAYYGQRPLDEYLAAVTKGHGCLACYKAGCRCDDCKAASTASKRRYREEHREAERARWREDKRRQRLRAKQSDYAAKHESAA